MKYTDLKKEIYGYYKEFDNIDIDNIQDINDHIIDEHINKSYLENNTYEFYITVSMCAYMIENELYDEYFFDAFNELVEEYESTKALINDNENELDNDIDNIKDYLKKDEKMEEYYNNLSKIYEDNINKLEDEDNL